MTIYTVHLFRGNETRRVEVDATDRQQARMIAEKDHPGFTTHWISWGEMETMLDDGTPVMFTNINSVWFAYVNVDDMLKDLSA